MPETLQKEIHVWRPQTDYAEGDYLFILNLDLETRKISFDLESEYYYPGFDPYCFPDWAGDNHLLDSKHLTKSELRVAIRNIDGIILRGLKEVEFPDKSGVYNDPKLHVKDAIPYMEWLVGRTKNPKEKENILWAINTLKKYGLNSFNQ